MDLAEKKKIVSDATFGDGDRQKLTCAQAFDLARDHGLSMAEIGQICDELKIKLTECQMGCFE